MTSVLKSCAGYCGMWIDQVFREAEVAAMLQQLQLRRSAGEPGCEPESEKIPEISLARSVQFWLNFRLERCDIIWRVLQKSIVSKSGFKQIAKTRWILQHFDGISLAKQNAHRGTSFLTSMCFQRKNDWHNLRKFQSNLRFGSQAKPGVVKCKLRVLPNERWQIKGLSMPFVSGGELVLLSNCDYTTDTVQFFWVCSAWDNVKGMLQSVEVGARLSKLSLD